MQTTTNTFLNVHFNAIDLFVNMFESFLVIHLIFLFLIRLLACFFYEKLKLICWVCVCEQNIRTYNAKYWSNQSRHFIYSISSVCFFLFKSVIVECHRHTFIESQSPLLFQVLLIFIYLAFVE